MGIVYHIEGTSDIACVASVSAWFGSKEFKGVHGVSKRGAQAKYLKFRSSVFLCSQTPRKRLLRRLPATTNDDTKNTIR